MQHIINSAQTCLDCKKPRCQTGCPVGTPIAEMIRLFLSGDIKEAGEKVFQNNPLSIICSLVCPHEKHCEGHCILNKKSIPVNVGGIENYISTYYMNYREFEKPTPNGRNLAIIGSGPAGISPLPVLEGYQYRLVDTSTLEVEVLREQGINSVFSQLSAQGIQVLSMRNKANRLEELFVTLVHERKGESA